LPRTGQHPRRGHPTRRASFPARAAAEGKTDAGAAVYVPDTEFSISKVSFGSILTPIGTGLILYGFGAYGFGLPGGDLSSLLFIYGLPISVLGFALTYAQVRGAGTAAPAARRQRHACAGPS
jgi:hypothetical protein